MHVTFVWIIVTFGVIIWTTTSTTAVSVWAILLEEARTCLGEYDVELGPGDINTQTIVAVIRDYSLLGPIYTCIVHRIVKYAGSHVLEKAFLGNMFDFRGDNISEDNSTFYFLSLDDHEWKCLDTAGSEDFFNDCLRISELFKYHNDLHTMCNERENKERKCMELLDRRRCASAVKQVIRNILSNIFGECHRTPAHILEISANSSFKACAVDVYGSKLTSWYRLFPSMEMSWSHVNRRNSLSIIQDKDSQHLGVFCKSRSNYAHCLRERLAADPPANNIDKALRLAINVTNLDNVFDLLCNNKDLIEENFICVANYMETITCKGGLTDIVEALAKKANGHTNGVLTFSCSNIKSRIACHVEQQLRRCSDRYAEVMTEVLNGLLNENCANGGLVMEDTSTDLFQCFGLENDIPFDLTQLNDKDVLRTICSNISQIIACIEAYLTEPNKSWDRLFSKMFSVVNIETILEYACSELPAFSEIGQCLDYSSNSCGNWRTVLPDWNQDIRTDNNIDDIVQQQCRYAERYFTCLENAEILCDGNARNFLSTFALAVYQSCGSPFALPDLSANDTQFPWFYHLKPLMANPFMLCLARALPDVSLLSLFPPSEFGRLVSTKPSMTKETHAAALSQFCGNMEFFTSCMEQQFSRQDNQFMLFYNISNIVRVIEYYCKNALVVSIQYRCTQQRTLPICKGGLLDVMNSFSDLIAGNHIYSCGLARESIHCHVEAQLAPCDQDYAEVMHNVLNGVLNQKCQLGGVVKLTSVYTDILPCIDPIMEQLYKSKTIDSLDLNGMGVYKELVCSSPAEFVSCLRERTKGSRKPYDVLINRLMTFDNLETISLQYLCPKANLFFDYAECTNTKIHTALSTPGSCVGGLDSIHINAELGDLRLLDHNVYSICRIWESYRKCLGPIYTSCNVELGHVFNTLTSVLHQTCGNLDFVLAGEHTSTPTTPESASRTTPKTTTDSGGISNTLYYRILALELLLYFLIKALF